MLIRLAPNGVDISKSGSLIGIVNSVSQYPVSAEAVEKSLGNPTLAQFILRNGAVVEVRFELVKDKDSESENINR